MPKLCYVLFVLLHLMDGISAYYVMRGTVQIADQFQNQENTTTDRCDFSYCSKRGAYCDATCCLCQCNFGESFYLGKCLEDHRAAQGCKYTIEKQFDPVMLSVSLEQLRQGMQIFHCSNVGQFDLCSVPSSSCKVVHAQSYYDDLGWKPLWEDQHVKDMVFADTSLTATLKLEGRACQHEKYAGLVIHLAVECAVREEVARSCVRLKVEGRYELSSNPNARVNCPPTLPPTTTATTTLPTTTQTTTTLTTTVWTTSTSQSTTVHSEDLSTETTKARVADSTVTNHTEDGGIGQSQVTSTPQAFTNASFGPSPGNVTVLGKTVKASLSTSELALTLVCVGMLILLVMLLGLLLRVCRKRRQEEDDVEKEQSARRKRTQKSHSTCELIHPNSLYNDYMNTRLSLENGTLHCDSNGQPPCHVVQLASTAKDFHGKNGELTVVEEGEAELYDTPVDSEGKNGTAGNLYAVVSKPKKSVAPEADEGYTSVDERSPKSTEPRGEKESHDLYSTPKKMIPIGSATKGKRVGSLPSPNYDVYGKHYDEPLPDPIYDMPDHTVEYDEPEGMELTNRKKVMGTTEIKSGDVGIRI